MSASVCLAHLTSLRKYVMKEEWMPRGALENIFLDQQNKFHFVFNGMRSIFVYSHKLSMFRQWVQQDTVLLLHHIPVVTVTSARLPQCLSHEICVGRPLLSTVETVDT